MDGGLNIFGYANQNPNNYSDAKGLIGAAARALLSCTMRGVAAPYHASKVNDKYKHCMVGALGAEKCGSACARLAAIGREVQNLFDNGDADLEDAVATLDGVDCAAPAS